MFYTIHYVLTLNYKPLLNCYHFSSSNCNYLRRLKSCLIAFLKFHHTISLSPTPNCFPITLTTRLELLVREVTHNVKLQQGGAKLQHEPTQSLRTP